METKTYLGDGVFAAFDGFHVVLTTENGIAVTNKIYLDPDVCIGLLKFFQTIKQKTNES